MKTEPCELFIPNVASPNCELRFKITSSCEFSGYNLLVFDRWGTQKTACTYAGKNGLDSLNNYLYKFLDDEKLKAGVYYYILKASNGNDTTVNKGNIAVIH